MLERLAKWSYRRRRTMLLIWIVALVGFIGLASTAGGEYSNDFSLPGAESQQAGGLSHGDAAICVGRYGRRTGNRRRCRCGRVGEGGRIGLRLEARGQLVVLAQ